MKWCDMHPQIIQQVVAADLAGPSFQWGVFDKWRFPINPAVFGDYCDPSEG